MAMIGADVVRLEALARVLKEQAEGLKATYEGTRRVVHTAQWNGSDADHFRAQWDGPVRIRISDASASLLAASEALVRHANEQREASAAGPGALDICEAPKVPATGAGEPDWLEDAKKALAVLGFSAAQIEAFLKALGKVDPSKLKGLLSFLQDNPGLIKGFELLGKAVDIVSSVVAFGQDFMANSHLPMDERIFHAAVVGSLGFLESAGAAAIGKVLGSIIGSAVAPPAGTFVGGMGGALLGTLIGQAIEQVDKATGMNSAVADLALEGYREAKDIAGFVGDAVGGAIDSVQDSAENVVGGAIDRVTDIGGGIKGILGL